MFLTYSYKSTEKIYKSEISKLDIALVISREFILNS